jgi:predicted nucleic acid-binding Zn ribbon protein
VATGTVCPICELPWWAPQTQHCCSPTCAELLTKKNRRIKAAA